MSKLPDPKFELNQCCNVCGSNDLSKITNKGQFGFTTNVCICKTCGLSFLNPRWDEASYISFYRNEYDAYYRPNAIDTSPEKDPCSYHPIVVRGEKVIDTFHSFENILDVGSGDGKLLSHFQDRFKKAKYYAIEPSLEHKMKLENRGITFVSDDVNSGWESSYNDSFDFIILRHVLEHFMDPVGVLKKLRATLNDKGYIYVAVPDSMGYNQPLTDSFFRVVHTYYFNRNSLTNVLHKAGFEVISIQEGDDIRKGELFLFAQKADKKIEVNIDAENFLRQEDMFLRGLKKEKSVGYKLRKILSLPGLNLLVKMKKIFFKQVVLKVS